MRHSGAPSKSPWTPLSLCQAISSLSYKPCYKPQCFTCWTSPFLLYVSERQGFALGVLGHNIGPSFASVTYLSKQLDLTTRGWAPCLRTLMAASLLIQESKKLTFGSLLTVYSSHSLSEFLTYKGLHSMPPSLILFLQMALVEDSTLSFISCSPLNPATLLPLSRTLSRLDKTLAPSPSLPPGPHAQPLQAPLLWPVPPYHSSAKFPNISPTPLNPLLTFLHSFLWSYAHDQLP
jgi:hypothetical protein